MKKYERKMDLKEIENLDLQQTQKLLIELFNKLNLSIKECSTPDCTYYEIYKEKSWIFNENE